MRIFALLLALLMMANPVFAVEFRMKDWSDPDAEPWKEGSYTLPAFPKDENLVEVYINATASAKVFVDINSISAGGEDQVVRYAVVVKTSGGASNISYEGLRCDTSQLQVYATGRADSTWAPTANPAWRPIKLPHQAVLARYFFCPNFIPVWSADEGRKAIKNGGHPGAPGRG
jgi:hypothetical protein